MFAQISGVIAINEGFMKISNRVIIQKKNTTDLLATHALIEKKDRVDPKRHTMLLRSNTQEILKITSLIDGKEFGAESYINFNTTSVKQKIIVCCAKKRAIPLTCSHSHGTGVYILLARGKWKNKILAATSSRRRLG
jgi:hypothetical protein